MAKVDYVRALASVKEIHDALIQLRASLVEAQALMANVQDTLDNNRALVAQGGGAGQARILRVRGGLLRKLLLRGGQLDSLANAHEGREIRGKVDVRVDARAGGRAGSSSGGTTSSWGRPCSRPY